MLEVEARKHISEEAISILEILRMLIIGLQYVRTEVVVRRSVFGHVLFVHTNKNAFRFTRLRC